MRSNICIKCHKPLSDPKSVERGMGPVCARRESAKAEMESGVILLQDPFLKEGLVCKRIDGKLACNIPIEIHHHAEGVEIGYSGSGPADLALNVLNMIFPVEPGVETTPIFNGKVCSRMAWNLHQGFKWKYIAGMDENGGRVTIEDIYQWIEEQGVKIPEMHEKSA